MSISANWNRENLAWAAGLFEGEGCISVKPTTVQMHLAMTDEDVVRKFHRIVGMGAVYGPRVDSRKAHFKPTWQWAASGQERMQALLAAFWSFLGDRRRNRAEDAIRKIAAQQPHGALKRSCKRGHAFTPENVYVHVTKDGQRHRHCKACWSVRKGVAHVSGHL